MAAGHVICMGLVVVVVLVAMVVFRALYGLFLQPYLLPLCSFKRISTLDPTSPRNACQIGARMRVLILVIHFVRLDA